MLSDLTFRKEHAKTCKEASFSILLFIKTTEHMKETILVTGGTGFIGSHTTVELQEAGYDVVIIDNLSNSNANVVDGIEKITGIRPAFEKVDLNDYAATEAVFKKYQIKGCIHFAASKAVGESVEKPLLYYRNIRVPWHSTPHLASCIFTTRVHGM